MSELNFLIAGPERDDWLSQDDDQLMRQCSMDFFKASGRGGQKRNKTSNAVRLIHAPTGITVSDCSGRSQHQNRHEALKKMRLEIARQVRQNPSVPPERLDVSFNNAAYPVYEAHLLDILNSSGFQISNAAALLEISTSRLVKLLARAPDLWQLVNQCREKCSLPPLKKN
jgi:hypothetical protein